MATLGIRNKLEKSNIQVAAPASRAGVLIVTNAGACSGDYWGGRVDKAPPLEQSPVVGGG